MTFNLSINTRYVTLSAVFKRTHLYVNSVQSRYTPSISIRTKVDLFKLQNLKL